MPTKAERILGYLPGTFRAQFSQSALKALIESFGGELQQAENQLAAVMLAHWVDHADRNASVIDDLARIGSLFGLAPREDEDVEQFRIHLKRFVRTFLEGPMTVQGILRVTAETLGLTIADHPEQLDPWWRRAEPELVTVETDPSDAAEAVFGTARSDDRGSAARRAEIAGTPDLGDGVDLREVSKLYVVIDDGVPVVVDLVGAAPDPSKVSLDHLVARINEVAGEPVARASGRTLTIFSPTIGPDSQLEIREGPDDAATVVLGLLPLTRRGLAEQRARVTGTPDLSAGVDLSDARFLRLLVDGTNLVEVEVAAPDDPGGGNLTFLDHVRDSINGALGTEVASHDGRHLILTSPSPGAAGSIAIERAAAQDAAQTLLGVGVSRYDGRDPQPAVVRGTVDLGEGVDLSEASLLRLRVDDIPTVTVDCAGAIPSRTTLVEIVESINTALGLTVAGRENARLVLRSPSAGPLAEIEIVNQLHDASTALLGIPPRLAHGTPATVAALTGTVDLSAGIRTSSRHLLEVSLDGGPYRRVDLRAVVGATPGLITLDQAVEAINATLGDEVATHDGEHLILRSRRPGGGSRVQLRPATKERRRRYVTRAFVTGEASRTLIGVDFARVEGDGASRAAVTGTRDLSHGVDLSRARYLRIALDDHPAREVMCSGVVPRATLIGEVVAAINTRFEDVLGHGAEPFATSDGRRITLVSPIEGIGSRISFEVPQSTDAREALLGLTPTTERGAGATGVAFVGVKDLSPGIDLPAHAAVKIAVDAAAPREVALTGEEPARRNLASLAALPNAGLGGSYIRTDGKRLGVVSPSRGAGSRLVFEPPSGTDATSDVFGIAPPRSYRGADVQPARIFGRVDLSGVHDLSEHRYLVIGVDDRPEVTVDCASAAGNPREVSLDDVVDAINSAFQAPVAAAVAGTLVLRSIQTGSAARIWVGSQQGDDARTSLFGEQVPPSTSGEPPKPAVLTGTADLLGPVDLSSRSLLRVAVDGNPPVDIDVAGGAPGSTNLFEVVNAIEAVLPGVASATPDHRLRLESPAAGPGSSIEVLPVRSLEVVEYPPGLSGMPGQKVKHGSTFRIENRGAGDTTASISLHAPSGTAGFALVNVTSGRQLQLLQPLAAGQSVTFEATRDGGVDAAVTGGRNGKRRVAPDAIRAGLLGPWVRVPFSGGRPVPTSGVQLDNPLGSRVDQLFGKRAGVVAEVRTPTVAGGPFNTDREDGEVVEESGRLVSDGIRWALQDSSGGSVELLQGQTARFEGLVGQVVLVTGRFHRGDPPYVLAQDVRRTFDVVLTGAGPDGAPVEERFEQVTIGESAGPGSLAARLMAGSASSVLAVLRSFPKAEALAAESGRSEWRVLEYEGSRFDSANFDESRFAGGSWRLPGIHDFGQFSQESDLVVSVFAEAGVRFEEMELQVAWRQHQPGAFEVNLPADLPARFGGRFDEAVFASSPERPERYEGVITEPPDQDNSLVAMVNATSVLVRAEPVSSLPIGFRATLMPARKPVFLQGGQGPRHARMYLGEEGAAGFVLLQAREHGPNGNMIKVSSRPAGPARFDVEISIEGARFESARAIVAGPTAPALGRSSLEALPLGIDQAKAAGVRARVTRDRTGDDRSSAEPVAGRKEESDG